MRLYRFKICTGLKPKINGNVFINKSTFRFKYIKRFEYFKHYRVNVFLFAIDNKRFSDYQIYFLISVNEVIFYDDLYNFCKTYIAIYLKCTFFRVP